MSRKTVSRRPAALRATRPAAIVFDNLFPDVMKRVGAIRDGVPASLLQETAQRMDMTRDRLYTALALPRSTVERKIQQNERLSPEHSERVLGLQRLVQQVDRMVRESGDAKGFDAARWLSAWLDHPQPAFGGMAAADLLDTMQGQELVGDLLARIQTGAYS